MPKTKKSLEEILEVLFNKGYDHAISGGKSDEGESKSVAQAKSDILALLDGLKHKGHILTTDEVIFNQGVQAARKRLEGR